MKVNWRIFTRRKAPLQSRYFDLSTISKKIESRNRIRVNVPIPYDVAERVDQFLRGKGLPKTSGIRKLIEYGLSNENEEELEKLRTEMQTSNLWGRYATMKFFSYQYFMENMVLTLKLGVLMTENHALKAELVEKGFRVADQDNYWDEGKKDEFWQKYIRTRDYIPKKNSSTL